MNCASTYFGSVERHGRACLARGMRVRTLQSCLLRCLSLGSRRCRCGLCGRCVEVSSIYECSQILKTHLFSSCSWISARPLVESAGDTISIPFIQLNTSVLRVIHPSTCASTSSRNTAAAYTTRTRYATSIQQTGISSHLENSRGRSSTSSFVRLEER